jgi:hypothetical protein
MGPYWSTAVALLCDEAGSSQDVATWPAAVKMKLLPLNINLEGRGGAMVAKDGVTGLPSDSCAS